MKGKKMGKRIIALVLALLMAIPTSSWSVLAAKYDKSDATTGLEADSMDVNDTIKLPIKIYDYQNDGMLFEYSETPRGIALTASDFGSVQMVNVTSADLVVNEYDCVTATAVTTDGSVPYVRVEWKADLPDWAKGDWNGNQPTIGFQDILDTTTWLGSIRYITFVYRSNVADGGMYLSVNRSFDTGTISGTNATAYGNYTGRLDFSNKGDEGTGDSNNWTYAVYDLIKGSILETWNATTTATSEVMYVGLPLSKAGDYIDIAHVGWFNNLENAQMYGEYAITGGSNQGDNRGFGLLRGSRYAVVGDEYNTTEAFKSIVDFTSDVKQIHTFSETQTDENGNAVLDDDGEEVTVDITSYKMSSIEGLGYTLLGTFKDNGIANIGLLESGLSRDGYPVYKKSVVSYLAELLKHSLEIPERTENGWKNYRYVKGAKSIDTDNDGVADVDVATALRSKINVTEEAQRMGSYDASLKKNLVGTWKEVSGNITTYYDAAYFLLNSIFVPGSYNKVQDSFKHLVLNAATFSETQGKTYIFDAGFADVTDVENATEINSTVNYDFVNKTISNSAAGSKPLFVYDGNGNKTTLFPFLPIRDENGTQEGTKSPYAQDDGVRSQRDGEDTYKNRNFNYVLVSEGEFVYHKDENLFFDFEGDDDVYLFINGELVMDIGSAHGIDGYNLSLNDYVTAAENNELGSDERNDKLKLVEGESYSFKFFYMERHGYGANMRINTNIKVTDPEIDTIKMAYQDGQVIEYGGVINKDKPVEYGFAIVNKGDENLYDLSFRDDKIGVFIDPERGLYTPGTTVCDMNGKELDPSDLIVVLSHPDYADIPIPIKDNDALKEVMKDLNSEEAIQKGKGLWPGSTLTIRGIGYEFTEQQKETGVFDNTVYSSARSGSEVRYGESKMRVYMDAALIYYQWANNAIKVNAADMLDDLKDRIEDIRKVTSIELTTKDGQTPTDDSITIENKNVMTINYDTTGPHVFYLNVGYKYAGSAVYDGDEIPECFGATTNDDGEYAFENAYGYIFDIDYKNGTIAGEDATIVTSSSYYSNANPNWAISVQLRPTGNTDEYKVIKVVKTPGSASAAGIIWESGDIVMVVHSADSKPGDYANWMDKVAALALKENDIVTVSSDMTTVTVAGEQLFSAEQIVAGVVNVTDVTDSVYVLDYGLSVDLLENDELFRNDDLFVSGQKTVNQVVAIGTPQEPGYVPNGIKFDSITETNKETGEYIARGEQGEFYYNPQTHGLKYTPTEFMDGIDSIHVAVLVREANYAEDIIVGTVDITKEVQMYKSISVLPANVVYYEDDFPAIHYTDNSSDEELKNVINEIGSSKDLTQSADQEQEYGQDDKYKDDMNADKSGNSIKEITIKGAGQVAYFDFTGTGFELISRTNASDSATIIVQLKNLETNDTKNIPVITEFDHQANGGTEEIYQVPVIRADGLTYGKYRVSILGVPAKNYDSPDREVIPTTLYIDGIRIFQPLAEEIDGEVVAGKNEHYTDAENGAQFQEIRDLIMEGNAAVVNYDGSSVEVSTGTVTWTENRNGLEIDDSMSVVEYVGNKVDSVNDYLMMGPNNETYMAGDYSTSALIFYVNPDTDSKGKEIPGYLQVALRSLDQGRFYGSNSTGTEAFLVYGIVNAEGEYEWMPLVTSKSVTEQYYTIDYTKCPKVEQGYQVAIQVVEGMVSYTSIKLNGLTLGDMSGEAATLYYEGGVLKERTPNSDSEGSDQIEESIDAAVLANELPVFYAIRAQMTTEVTYIKDFDVEEDGVKEGILYQKRNNSDVRLIAYVDDLTAYSSVSFALTINGRESRALECTTAYSGLYSNGVLKTTKDIYGEDGYFVTYTINDYMEAFGGQEVIITATYTTVTGETITDVRAAKIQ